MGAATVAPKSGIKEQDFIGTFEIVIEATINVDPRSAKRKVTGWVVSEVGNLLFTAQPKLVIGKRTVWRVPVVLTSKTKGLTGEIGSVDVDADTGALLVSDNLADELLNNAKTLVSSAQTTD